MTVMTNRQTGRTQRMLEAAVEEARKGEYVMIFANDGDHVGLLYDRLLEFEGASPTNRENGKVYFEAHGGEVSVISRQEEGVDLRRGISRGAHPSISTFLDHYAAEEFIREQGGWAWAQLTRWESPDAKSASQEG